MSPTILPNGFRPNQVIYALNVKFKSFSGPYPDMQAACTAVTGKYGWNPEHVLLINATGQTFLPKQQIWSIEPEPGNHPVVRSSGLGSTVTADLKLNSWPLNAQGVPLADSVLVGNIERPTNTDRYIGLSRDDDEIDLDLQGK